MNKNIINRNTLKVFIKIKVTNKVNQYKFKPYPPQSQRLRTKFPRNLTWECSTSTTKINNFYNNMVNIIIIIFFDLLNR